MSQQATSPLLSVVVPVFNEQESIDHVLSELRQVLDDSAVGAWEAVIVNDGSRDATADCLEVWRARDARFRAIHLRQNAGQTAAFDAGFKAARGEFIGMMDGDGQNDPRDFPRLLEELTRTGVDMMCGYRARRQDNLVRIISSRVANDVRNYMTGETIRDVGCSIRVFRRTCLDRIKLYRNMHRFFPTLVRMEGFRIGEIPVNHRPRQRGKSKYGVWNRLWVGIADLFAVRWMQRRSIRYEVVEAAGLAHERESYRELSAQQSVS